MKRLLAILALLGLPVLALAQATNPQPDYVTAMQQAHPSLWLNFNDTTAAFKDRISGLVFSDTRQGGQLNEDMTFDGGRGYVAVTLPAMTAGNLESVSLKFYSAPLAGEVLTVVVACGTLPNLTIADSFTVTLTTAHSQSFYAGTDFSPRTVASSCYVGSWVPTTAPTGSISTGNTNSTGNGSYYIAASTALPSGSQTYSSTPNTTSIAAFTAGTSLATPRQPGFDLRWPNNTSAEFPYNSNAGAPNTTLGDLEWSNPWSIEVVVDKIDYDRLAGTPLILASKGDVTCGTCAYWELEVAKGVTDGDTFPLVAQVCWVLQAPTPGIGGSNVVHMDLCTNAGQDIVNANAAPYVFTLTNDGGGWTSDFHFYIQGIDGGGSASNKFLVDNNLGFDPVTLSVSGGTGYADVTAFTSTGGGTNCVVIGTMSASGGVPTGITTNGSGRSSGCTSTPTIVLTSPTGTGAVITATPHVSTLSTGTSYPLMIGSLQGLSTDTSQTPVNIDEFAVFPTALTQQQISSLWNGIPWYQTMLGAPPAVPPVVLLDDDAGGDLDNNFAIAEYIALAQKRYLQPVGVVVEDTAGSCNAMWRQMLDQAGLGNVPIATAYTFSSGGSGCYPTNIATYNASTPTASSAYESATTLYRTVLAAHPSTPVDIVLGGQHTGLAAFMQSGADGISPLTGAELLAQDATNGGVIYDQGNPLASVTCTPSAPPNQYPCSGTTTGVSAPGWDWASTQYVYAHNADMPIYVMPQTPQNTGPGVFSSRTAKDPLYMFFNSSSSDVRQGWDPMVLAQIVTPKLRGGLQLAYSGGTGCPDDAPLVSSGGGGEIDAWLRSSGGVPNGVLYPGGGWAVGTWQGIGDSYTSVPTITATGCSGVTITPYLTTGCVTYTISDISTPTATISVDSATCSHQYQTPFSWKATSIGDIAEPTWLLWFVNSLDNPMTVPRPLQP